MRFYVVHLLFLYVSYTCLGVYIRVYIFLFVYMRADTFDMRFDTFSMRVDASSYIFVDKYLSSFLPK